MPDQHQSDLNVTTVYLLLERVERKVDGINTRLDTQNGRIGKAELSLGRQKVFTGITYTILLAWLVATLVK